MLRGSLIKYQYFFISQELKLNYSFHILHVKCNSKSLASPLLLMLQEWGRVHLIDLFIEGTGEDFY